MPIYLDCNATTPLDPEVWRTLQHFLTEEFGNEGSRTHEFGTKAKQAIGSAREQVAVAAGVQPDEVVFTSGATESNNLAILGLTAEGERTGRRHVITSSIEHKAVLEPVAELVRRGFEATHIPCNSDGRVDIESLRAAIRSDTLMVSIMHSNNETGILQPLSEIAELLAGHSAYFHVDGAQGFGKDIFGLRNKRIDLLSLSGHKIFAPKGVGALITRRRGYQRPPLSPLMHGGGQERGLRPGTLPVALIAALGMASEVAVRDADARRMACVRFRDQALTALLPLAPMITGNTDYVMPHVLNLRFPGLDSEALMVACKDLIAVSNGSACTSRTYSPSHVLKAMGFTTDEANECIRISWCHLTPAIAWQRVSERIQALR